MTAAVLALAAGACGRADVAPRRVLVVGWDGATFELLDPLLRAGRLPHLAALAARGRTAVLESTAVPISSAAWTTITTGKEPGATGVYSFFQPIPGSYEQRLVSARDVRAAPLWRTLVARGHEVVVWGVPVSWPPEPVTGTLVAGMLSPEDDVWTYPEALTETLRARGLAPDLGVWRTMRELTPERIDAQLALKEAALLEALANRRWSFALVVFKELDVLAHRAYSEATEGPVPDLLVALDRSLGRLVEAAGPGADVFLISDHGFATYSGVFDLDAWLLAEGFASRRSGVALPEPATGPLATARAAERGARLGALDWSRTVAYADLAEGNFGAIRLNVAGREPSGVLAPEAREATLARLRARLAALEYPVGTPLVRNVWTGDELYPGPERERVVPDLVFELAPTCRATASGFGPALATAQFPFPEHARDGVLVAAGPSLARHTGVRARWRLIDLAPTWLHLLDEPVPSGLRGALPTGLLARPRPLRRIDEGADPSVRSAEEAYRGLPAPGESAEVRKRLAALGYTE